MALDYRDLDQTTRHFMVDEIDMDVANGSIYLSSWLSEAGIRDWPMLLRQAAESHDDDWLAHQLRGTGRLHESVPRRTEGRVYYRQGTHHGTGDDGGRGV